METVVQVAFGLVAALIVGAAVMVVTVRNVIHAALWLIASFFGVAALYMLLEAEFIAVVQVLVYVGAISILILFAIMLTRQVTGEGVRQLTSRWWVSLIVAAALFAAVIVPTVINHQWNIPATPPAAEGAPPEALSGPAELGRGFVFEYMIQFQVAGVLLTVALIGAIVIAFEERARRRRVLTLAEEHELRKAAARRRAPVSEAEAQRLPPPPQIAPATDGE